jgi:TIR domain
MGGNATELVIPTYFSHSYRKTDRDLNISFWEMFHDNGFAFTVDPRSGPLSTPHLEHMMKQSACFVAVVTRRDGQRRYRCSPFARYEFGLAVQANVRSLVLVERGVPARWFPEGPRRSRWVFDRNRLGGNRLMREIEEFAEMSLPEAYLGDQLSGDVGLILPDGEGYEQCRDGLVDMLDGAGYTAVPVRLDAPDTTSLALELDGYDFIVMDVASPQLPSWVLGLVRGRFIPTVQLVRLPPDGTPPLAPNLSVDAALASEDPEPEQFVCWSTPADLIAKLEQHIDMMHLPRRQFTSLEEGNQYFHSLGRAAAGPVFLSNAGPDDALASQVARAFDLHNISYFHYLYSNTIQKGADWEDKVLPKVAESTVFVALLSERYWQSDWCKREFEYAEQLRGKDGLAMLPFFLDSSKSHHVPAQGTTVTHLPTDQQVAEIVKQVDDVLTAEAV